MTMSTINNQQSTINNQQSTINNQQSTINNQQSTISVDVSKRITSLRFLLMVFVIFIHASPSDTIIDKSVWYYIKNFLLNICDVAVPLFFLFSGYLQFKKRNNYLNFLKKRFHSLIIPYFLWTVICIIFYLCIQNVFHLTHFFREEDIINNWKLRNYLEAFTYHRKDFYLKQPLLGQYWFLRELIILSIISPIINIWFSKSRCSLLVFSIITFFYNLPLYIIVDTKAFFFYVLGLFFANFKESFFSIVDKINIQEYLIFILLIQLFKNIFPEKCNFFPIELIINCMFILRLSVFFIKNNTIYYYLEKLAKHSFFLYSIHYPFLILPLKAVLPKLIKIDCIQFFSISLICIILGLSISKLLNKFCYPIYKCLNGSR